MPILSSSGYLPNLIIIIVGLLLGFSCDSILDQSSSENYSDPCSGPVINDNQVAIRIFNNSAIDSGILELFLSKDIGYVEYERNEYGIVESKDTTCYAIMNIQYDSIGVKADYNRYILWDHSLNLIGFPGNGVFDLENGYYTYILEIQDSILNYVDLDFIVDTTGPSLPEVNIRVFNNSNVDYDSLKIFFPDSLVNHGSLLMGEYGPYVTVPASYSHATTYVYWDNKVAVYQVEDYMGEQLLTGGYYTFRLDIYESIAYKETGFFKAESTP